MITNNTIQAALISKLLANITITAELDDAEEIRENEWQGTAFSYPNIRVRIISNDPLENTYCTQTKVSV